MVTFRGITCIIKNKKYKYLYSKFVMDLNSCMTKKGINEIHKN